MSDLQIRNDVRAEDCRSDRPPAEDRRRMGFGRLVQRHHDLPGNHGDRSRPVRDCRGHLCRQPEVWIRGRLQLPARRRRALRLVCGVVFLCDDRAPPHGRARHAARGVGRCGCGRPAPWSAESECAVAQAARARRVHGHAADGRAVLPRRLHTRLGRRSRRRGDEYGTGQEDGRAETGARPGLRIWPDVVGRDAAARHDFDAGESRRRNCVQDGRPETQRHGRRANLRLFHHHGIDDARRLRLCQEGADRRLREGWQHRDRRRAADEHVGRTPVGDRHARHAADPRGRPADARRRFIASQRRKTLHHF